MNLKCFTVEVFKSDKRIKDTSRSVRHGNNKPGLRFIESVDYEGRPKSHVRGSVEMRYPSDKGYVIEIFETYVTKRNAITGKEFQERYDTPYYCSPSSETYWSM